MLPLLRPVRGRDGRALSEIAIAAGTTVFPHLQAGNVGREIWGEDAAEWRPERWLAPLPRAVEDARIPGVYAHL